LFPEEDDPIGTNGPRSMSNLKVAAAGGCAHGEDHVDWMANQVGRQRRQPEIRFGPLKSSLLRDRECTEAPV
jgi:hypothetical protein